MPQRWITFFAAVVLVVATAVVGVTQSIDEMRRLAQQGDADAQYNLALMYANGEGVPQDDVQAYIWFSLSASRRSGEARDRAVNHRNTLYETLTFDERTEAQRLAREWDEAHPQ